MKKLRKPRVDSIVVDGIPSLYYQEGVDFYYYLVRLYDKKGREIPSSVNCAYSSAYYSHEQILKMAKAL
jgi:hypothetical protein